MIPIRIVLAATALSVAGLSGAASASDRLFWEQQPAAAYFAVYDYYCAPAGIALAGNARPAPQGAAALIHEDLFLARYGGDCRQFYFVEIESRIQGPEEHGFVVVRR